MNFLPYTVSTAYSVLSECLWKHITGDSGGIWTHDLLFTSADILTSLPPSLPDDDWPARIPYSSGFRDIYRLMKFLRRMINNWFNFALHRRVYSTAYSVLSECLWINFTWDSGGIRTYDLLLTKGDILNILFMS